MTIDYLVSQYINARADGKLENGTMNAEETAGYWLYEASHAPREELNRMLKENGYESGYEDKFYGEVLSYLAEVGE